jgi:hypothetical protein
MAGGKKSITRLAKPDSSTRSDIPPERLPAAELAPENVLGGMAATREQSAAKSPEESTLTPPAPAGPDDIEGLDRMLASAGVTEEKRKGVLTAVKDLMRLAKTRAERLFFWRTETDGGMNLPRPSIVGRHLHDEKMTENRKHLRVHPNQVFLEIHKNGSHHLSDTDKKHLRPELTRRESQAAASHFIKHFTRRVGLLKRLGYVDVEDKNVWLTKSGAKVFKAWPWWLSRDDEVEPRLDSEPSAKKRLT